MIDEEQLISDIRRWLLTAPSSEDILYYVRHLPEENKSHFMEGCRSALNTLLSRKFEYFRSQKAEIFTRELPESAQFEFINYFVLYNSFSVLQRLKDKFPKCSITELSSDINKWSITHLSQWDAILKASSAPSFLNHLVYLKSFLNSQKIAPYLSNIENTLEAITLRTFNHLEKDEIPQAGEITEERELILDLGIFPKEYVEYILNPVSLLEKSILYDRLLTVVILINSQAAEKESKSFAVLSSKLWSLLKKTEETEIFAQKDAEYLTGSSVCISRYQLYTFFTHLWTVENIRSGIVTSTILRYLSSLSQTQKNFFYDGMYHFLANSIVISTLLYPLDSNVVVGRLKQAISIGLINSEIGKIVEQTSEESRFLVTRFLEEFRSIHQTPK